MPKVLSNKYIEFTIEFEKPPRDEVVERVPCRVCRVKAGERCHTQTWTDGGGNKMSDLHHDRYAEYMNLQVVASGRLYRIK